MKKVLIVFDGAHFSMSVFDFACRLNETRAILLTGVFLPSNDFGAVVGYYVGIEGPLYNQLMENEKVVLTENIEKFKTLCEKNGISYRVHDRMGSSVLESIRGESRYADILLLSSELFYKDLGAGLQRQYLHDATCDSECPVLLLPEQYQTPGSIVLAYDGSASSVFAIKQFAYLFPELTSLDAILVYASDEDVDLPDFDYIKEFAARHFPSLNFLKLDVDPRHYFNTWVQDAGPSLLVSGSYGRSLASQMFKRSFISEIIKDHKMPVFAAHK